MNLDSLFQLKCKSVPEITDIHCTTRNKPALTVPIVYHHYHNVLHDSVPGDVDTFTEWYSLERRYPHMINSYGLDSETWRALYNPFVSVDVQFEVEQNLLECCCTKFMIGTLNVSLRIYHNKESPDEISACTKELAEAICYIYQISQKYGNFLPNHLKLNVWRTNKNKCFPKNFNPITCKHVNSGSTSFSHGLKPECIDIWRKEELLKVTIHELIHFFKWDFFCDFKHTKLLRNHISFSKKSHLTLNEAYTECMTVLIYSFIKSKSLAEAKLKISEQYKHALTRSALILNHLKISLPEIEQKSNQIHLISDVFSYHVLKAALLSDYNYLLQWLQNNVSLKHQSDMIDYQNMLINQFKKPKFKRELQYYCSYMSKNTHGHSLRMTI